MLTLWWGESCFLASLLRTKTEPFGERGSVSPGSLQDGKLTTTSHLYQTNTKWFGWKPLSEAEPESTSAGQEPLIPTRAANETLLWGGKCSCWDSTRMHLSQGAEPQGQRELCFPARGIKFSISWDFFFYHSDLFSTWNTNSCRFFSSHRLNLKICYLWNILNLVSTPNLSKRLCKKHISFWK